MEGVCFSRCLLYFILSFMRWSAAERGLLMVLRSLDSYHDCMATNKVRNLRKETFGLAEESGETNYVARSLFDETRVLHSIH